MKKSYPVKPSGSIVNVFNDGAVRLSSNVVCDGYVEGCSVRVQTHIHDDHMLNFDKSKGLQNIIMSPETFQLLVAERNADLEFRENICRIPFNKEVQLDDGSKLTLLSSNHMLGSCQVLLELSDGSRVGYSGDFGWPIKDVVQVDQLVVDSTYGSPDSIRRYTQSEAEACLYELVTQKLRHGPVHIKAFRGTIERVLNVLGDNVDVPIYATEGLIKQVEVYQQHGFATATLRPVSHRARGTPRNFIRLYSKGDGFFNEPNLGTTITCSAYMVKGDQPLHEYSDRGFRVALSNHADFNQTLHYVERTGATKVITDNTKQHGFKLADAINQRLNGVRAEPSTNERNFS